MQRQTYNFDEQLETASMQDSGNLKSDSGVRQMSTAQMRSSAGFLALSRLQEIERIVDSLVASWQSARSVLESRRWHRVAYQQPMILTPLDDLTDEPIGQPRTVWGRDISIVGISFTHLEPMPFRKVAVTFNSADGGRESVVTRLTWCRFTRKGVYQSGGKFVRSIDLSSVRDVDTNRLARA